jgi:hypothetical protein
VAVSWVAKPSASWIKVSSIGGELRPLQNQTTHRFWISVDWTKAPSAKQLQGFVEIIAGGKKETIRVMAQRPSITRFSAYKGVVEENGLVSIFAGHFTANDKKANSRWQVVEGLGHSGNALQAFVKKGLPVNSNDTVFLSQNAAQVQYTFFSLTGAAPTLSVFTLPTHPLNKEVSMRYAVRVDDGPLQMVDFRTVGRSEEWKQNVLRNAAVKVLQLPCLQPGEHTLNVYAVDPGVVLDRLLLQFGGAPTTYGLVPETTKK